MSISFWFKFAIWIGWLSGIILLDSPIGLPSLKSWCSWHCLYAVIAGIIQHLTFLSYVMRIAHLENFYVPATGGLDMKALAVRGLFMVLVVLTLVQRLYLWGKGKRLAKFLRDLDTYDFFGERKNYTQHYPHWILAGIAIFYFILVVAVVLLQEIVDYSKGYHGNFMAAMSYWVLTPLSIFSRLVLYFVNYISVLIIVTSTVKILFILGDFCDHLEFSISLASSDLMEILKPPGGMTRKLWKQTSSHFFLKKFENLKELFRIYDTLFGPLFFIFLLSSFIGILHGFNSILVEQKSILVLIADLLRICSEIHFILLVELGHGTHKMIRERKDKLKFLQKQNKGNTPADDTIELFLGWDWHINASGFFVMDRHLASGLLTATMTYIIILFQLNDSDSARRDLTNNNGTYAIQYG